MLNVDPKADVTIYQKLMDLEAEPVTKNLDYRSHYFDDPDALAAFEKYAETLFGLDFNLWRDKGLWDKNYTAFSAFDGDECVASICVYPSDITFRGNVSRWAQLLTVGTRPEYRGRGIQRELWNRSRTWIDDQFDMTFLFTDDVAAGFYEKLGFVRQAEYFDVTHNVTGVTSAGAPFQKLDLGIDGDFSILKRLAFDREPVSNVLGFRNPKLLLFMFLYQYRDWTYYIEELDTIVVVEQTDSAIRVHDIVAERMPMEHDLEFLLGTFRQEEIHWLFCTDRLVLSALRREEVTDDVLIVSPEFKSDQKLTFPSSIRA